MVLMNRWGQSESFRALLLLMLCFGLLWTCGCNSAEKEYRPIAKPNDGRFEVKSFTINGVGEDDELVVKLGSQMQINLNLVLNDNEHVGTPPVFRFYTQLQEDRGKILAGSAVTTLQSGRIDQSLVEGERNYQFKVTVPDHDDIVERCEKLHGGRFFYFAITHLGRLIASRRIDFTE